MNFQNENITNFKIEGIDAIKFVINENNMLQYKDEKFVDLQENYTIEICAVDDKNNITMKNVITIITHRTDEPERKFLFFSFVFFSLNHFLFQIILSSSDI